MLTRGFRTFEGLRRHLENRLAVKFGRLSRTLRLRRCLTRTPSMNRSLAVIGHGILEIGSLPKTVHGTPRGRRCQTHSLGTVGLPLALCHLGRVLLRCRDPSLTTQSIFLSLSPLSGDLLLSKHHLTPLFDCQRLTGIGGVEKRVPSVRAHDAARIHLMLLFRGWRLRFLRLQSVLRSRLLDRALSWGRTLWDG